ncbi:hypothetical protein [Streptomyces sp. AC627_RSS907]|uniref:hypothetical protein n=1 Tax=Streptomyces sp. AC627_RSS907 TaxID=2823684 RepID=UPI0027E42604|nr:hypothetical protein [Streptomyces sp. AC627_RSS907]
MTWVTAESTASTASVTSAANVRSTAARAPGPGGSRRRARRPFRAAAAAVGLVGALVLTACTDEGGSDDGAGGGDAPSAVPSGSASPSPSPSASADPGAGTGGGLDGSWLATTGGDAVALMVTGDKAALFATGGAVCSGTADEGSGARTIRLKCTDGSDDRATGTVESVDGTSLTVKWRGALGEETYTRSEGGSLPPGLPTAGLGS